MSFIKTVPKNPKHISKLKFTSAQRVRVPNESYQIPLLKVVENIKQ
jgi:hypothetical protein